MEFQIQNMLLLDEVRKLFTKKIHLSLPLLKVNDEFVDFMEENQKKYPGNTELIIHIADWDGHDVRLKSQNKKIEVNDDLIKFITEHEEIQYSLDKV